MTAFFSDLPDELRQDILANLLAEGIRNYLLLRVVSTDIMTLVNKRFIEMYLPYTRVWPQLQLNKAITSGGGKPALTSKLSLLLKAPTRLKRSDIETCQYDINTLVYYGQRAHYEPDSLNYNEIRPGDIINYVYNVRLKLGWGTFEWTDSPSLKLFYDQMVDDNSETLEYLKKLLEKTLAETQREPQNRLTDHMLRPEADVPTHELVEEDNNPFCKPSKKTAPPSKKPPTNLTGICVFFKCMLITGKRFVTCSKA